ncbi:DMT family transporter [Telmatospirillum siberiense]|uniref:EamA family transporter n=1 Tax=Telmatospirillum siberiense TaxID=382514 RepID=A0A2N3Q0E4_9PROT|nr:DMT family transporter [Telmatospirillum siberiense]PKU26137.1 EamA family transporter [Telmatospirillum siberiense]
MSVTTPTGAYAAVPRVTITQSAPWLTVMVLFWGLSWPAMKLAVGVVPPLWLSAIRFGSASACLFALLALRGGIRLPPRADWPILASIGGLQMMAFTALGLTAMQYTDAGRAAVLGYTTPLWGVLAAWAFAGQRPTAWQGSALAVGMSGVALICSPLEMDWGNPNVVKGNLFLLLAAICWSLVILHVRRHRFMSRPIDLAPWQMLFAAIPLAAAALVWEGVPSRVEWTPDLLALLAYIGPVATSACFVISTDHGRRISTFAMSNVTMGVPIVGVLSSSALLGEHITRPLGCGMVLIVAGTVLAALAVRRKAVSDSMAAERNGRQRRACAMG